MKRIWVVVAVCTSCKAKHAEEKQEPAARVTAPVKPSSGREITSPLPEKGPHPEYPTAAAAGTDKLFFLEEPDRGPAAPASFTPPARGSLTWTTSPYCEVDQLGVACTKDPATPAIHWRVGRGKGITMVEELRGERVASTIVFVTGPDGKLAQRLGLDAVGQIDEALLFTTPGRFSGRKLDGSNALPGCGLLAFEEDKQHQLAELRCLQWLGEPMRDTSGIAVRRYSHDAHGFVVEERRFGLDGAPAVDLHGVHRTVYTRDASGRVDLQQDFDTADQRVISTTGCAGERRAYSPLGTVARTTCLDRSDAPIKDGDGVTVRESTSDAAGCQTKLRYFHDSGAVAKDHAFLHGYDYEVDASCLQTSQTCIGAKDMPTSCGPGRPAKQVFTRDALGRLTSIHHFDAKGAPGGDAAYHVHELRYVNDARGNRTEMACFDARGAAVECASTGFHGWRSTYDDAGRRLTLSFFGTEGAPATNRGIAQRRFRYDNYDHEYEDRNFDADGKLLQSDGMAIRHNLYDATHVLFAIQLLDAQDRPASYTACYTGVTCPDRPWHAVRLNRRANGRVETNVFFDADGQLLETIDCRAKPCFD